MDAHKNLDDIWMNIPEPKPNDERSMQKVGVWGLRFARPFFEIQRPCFAWTETRFRQLRFDSFKLAGSSLPLGMLQKLLGKSNSAKPCWLIWRHSRSSPPCPSLWRFHYGGFWCGPISLAYIRGLPYYYSDIGFSVSEAMRLNLNLKTSNLP